MNGRKVIIKTGFEKIQNLMQVIDCQLAILNNRLERSLYRIILIPLLVQI